MIMGSFVLGLHFFCYCQTGWQGNYWIDQSYPKKMPDEMRKDIWSKLEIAKNKLNDKLAWKYSSKHFLHFCEMSGYASGTEDSLALFFEKYDSCSYAGETTPGSTTPYLILKRKNEKYFVCEAQVNEKQYALVAKQKTE